MFSLSSLPSLVFSSCLSPLPFVLSFTLSAGFWVTGESLPWLGGWWTWSRRSKTSLPTASWPEHFLPPLVLLTTHLLHYSFTLLKMPLYVNLFWISFECCSFLLILTTHNLFHPNFSLTFFLLPSSSSSSSSSFLLLCAPLAPPSGKFMFLWPVHLLLFNWTRSVWSSHEPGGLPGCHAPRPLLGHPEVLEIPLETLLQPQQTGKVSRYWVFSQRETSVLCDLKLFNILSPQHTSKNTLRDHNNKKVSEI